MRAKLRRLLPAFKAAFPYTLPIATAYFFVGVAYGIYVVQMGLPAWLPSLMSILIFAGSMEFLMASLLLAPDFDPLGIFLMTLIVNARHLFYGLCFLGRLSPKRPKSLYAIYALTDETFALNQTLKAPEGIEDEDFIFAVSLLDQVYWVLSASLGGFVGPLLSFDIPGISFVMPALFVVLFLEQLKQEGQSKHAYLGLGLGILCLYALGAKHFILYAMALLIVIYYLLYRKELRHASN